MLMGCLDQLVTDIFISLCGRVVLLPFVLIIAFPYVLVAAALRDGLYGRNVSACYREVYRWWWDKAS